MSGSVPALPNMPSWGGKGKLSVGRANSVELQVRRTGRNVEANCHNLGTDAVRTAPTCDN